MYPVMLDLKGRHCLVVGGGSVAERKVEGLLADNAIVTVVATVATSKLRELADGTKVTLHERAYQKGEGTQFQLVFAATDDRDINRQVFEEANAAGTWVNVADDPPLCTFHLPARIRRGAFQLAIASAGKAPFAVRRMRKWFERKFGPEWTEWIDSAARFRNSVRAHGLSASEQERAFDAFFEGTLNLDTFQPRVPSSDEEVAWMGVDLPGVDAPSDLSAENKLDADHPPGLVSLVGAGPGDPGLLTLRGRQRLMAADAVVCDRLALTALPCDLPDETEIRFVGKTAGNHPIPQKEINAMLIRLANEGKRVVRLKGGDPYIFGRGGEEAKLLAAAGIPFEVVPCVTAAVAVPTYAGIPITFRNEIVRVTLITAHEAKKDGGPQVKWDQIATDPHAMLLGYMGVTQIKAVTQKLLEAGMDPEMPAALIERGTTSRQRVVTSKVRRFAEDVKAAELKPPALFAIGSTVQHRETLDWFGKRPLLGQRLVITPSAKEFEEALELAGAELVPVGSPITNAARMVMDVLPLTGCVLSNAADVELVDSERDAPSWVDRAVAWCLSAKARQRAEELGWQHVEDAEMAAANGELATFLQHRILTF